MDATTLVPALLVLAVGGVGWLVRQLDAARTKRIEEKMGEHSEAIKAGIASLSTLAERIRLDELATKDAEKEIALVKQAHDHLDGVLKEIRNSIRALDLKIDEMLRGRTGQRPGQYSSTAPTSEDRFPKTR